MREPLGLFRHKIGDALYRFVDLKVVDGLVNLAGRTVQKGSAIARYAQEGSVGVYVFAMVAGVIALLFYNLFT